MKYIADNGKIFDSLEECKREDSRIAEAKAKAEAEAAAKKAEREALIKERSTRAKEVEDAIKHANELMDKFVKDYGSFHMSITEKNPMPFDSLFDVLFRL